MKLYNLMQDDVLAGAVIVGRPLADLGVPSNSVHGRPGFFTKSVSG